MTNTVIKKTLIQSLIFFLKKSKNVRHQNFLTKGKHLGFYPKSSLGSGKGQRKQTCQVWKDTFEGSTFFTLLLNVSNKFAVDSLPKCTVRIFVLRRWLSLLHKLFYRKRSSVHVFSYQYEMHQKDQEDILVKVKRKKVGY